MDDKIKSVLVLTVTVVICTLLIYLAYIFIGGV